MPGVQGGPLMHAVAGKAVCFAEAMTDGFVTYVRQIRANADVLAKGLIEGGLRLVTGGTENHLVLVDLTPADITGKDGEHLLESIGVTCNKNQIPFDPRSPFVTSGVRLGTPALTSRGMKETEFAEIADIITTAFKVRDDEAELDKLRERVADLCARFPLYESGSTLYGSPVK